MRGLVLLAGLAVGIGFATAAAAQGAHPTPTPDVLERLRRQHHASEWLRVSTDDARFEARVGAFAPDGLTGLTARPHATPVPAELHWESIARVDRVTTSRLRGRITWGILGAIGGSVLTVIPGDQNGADPKPYLLGGAILGAVLGDYLGSHNVHERALYVAPTLAPPSAPPSPPPAAAAQPSIEPERAAAVTTAADSAQSQSDAPAPLLAHDAVLADETTRAISRACRRLSSQDLMRVEGDFGVFHGYASGIAPEGLSGLRVETRRSSVQPPNPLTWERIHRIDVHGSNAGSGALRGAMTLGLAAGLLGFAVGEAVGSDSDQPVALEAAVGAAAIGGAVGGLFGLLIGATVSSWHRVYVRP